MSKSIYNVSLLDIMPQSLLSDPFVVAMARSIDPELQGISAEIIKCILLPRIDELPGEVVDVLAWQFHADFYRPNLPIAIKRQILKNSLKWQRTKGTPAVVEDLLITIFEDRVRLVEWFDYNASPYFFKVVADNSPSFTEVANFFKLIATVKNSRSWLDKVHVINDGLFLIPKNKRIYFEHETGAVYSGQWVFAKSTGLVCFKVIEAGAVSLAGTYTFPYIGVSTGLTTELTAALSPYSVTGIWLYPRASIKCGVSPEAQVIGQLASTQITADTKAIAGIYVFPYAGVSIGASKMMGAKNTIYVTAGINSYIRCGAYNSGQEVA